MNQPESYCKIQADSLIELLALLTKYIRSMSHQFKFISFNV